MFGPTINQMATLLLFMAIGFIVTKAKVVNADAAKILARLENTVFIPALILNTFKNQFTLQTFFSAWKLLLFSLLTALIIIPAVLFIVRFVSKDSFIRKISAYGLCFSNFSFMGNAVVTALYGEEFFMNYFIFTLPLWILIYMWGAPALLMGCEDEDCENNLPCANGKGACKKSFKDRMKTLINPMMAALFIGMILGLTGIGPRLPGVVDKVISTCSGCMSPIAMILTGITFAGLNFKKVLSTPSVYVVSALRLLVIPFTIGGITFLIDSFVINIPTIYYISFICVLSMPLGLNSIIVPAAYGRDTSVPAGMALVSHILSILTIPLILSLLC